jgi:hypothetical protein
MTSSFPPWRERLLVLARLSDREAELVKQSRDCIAESKDLIARAEILICDRGAVATHTHFTDGILRGGLNYKFY